MREGEKDEKIGMGPRGRRHRMTRVKRLLTPGQSAIAEDL